MAGRDRPTPPSTGPQDLGEAAVHRGGTVHEVAGGHSARLLREQPGLVRLAEDFLRGPEGDLSFYWQGDGTPWYSVNFARERAADGPDHVAVLISREDLPFGITVRELDVLTLLAGGLGNNEIAAELVTSVRTVSSHVEHLLRKTELPNRAALAALAVRRGIVRLPSPARSSTEAEGGLHPASQLTSGRAPRTRNVRIERRPLIIGTALPIQGTGSADGFEMRNGAALAIEEINARGGIGGRSVRQIIVDVDISDPVRITRSFEELIGSEVDAITSGYFLVEDAVLDLAVEYGAPYLHAMTAESSVNPDRRRGSTHPVFQVCPSETVYGPRFIGFLDELVASGAWTPDSRELVFVESAVPGGQMANLDTVRAAERSGWSIARTTLLPMVVDDWAPVVSELHRRPPAAVMITQFVPEQLAAFQVEFAREPSPSLVYSVYTPSIPEFGVRAGASAEGLLWSTVSGTYGDLLGQGFLQRYRRAFGRPPGRSHAGIAYDEIHLLAQAWARVENPRSFTEVTRQLRASTFRGVNGSYYLDNVGQSGLGYPDATLDPSLGQAHLIFQIQDGKHRILSPIPYNDSTFRLPRWIATDSRAGRPTAL